MSAIRPGSSASSGPSLPARPSAVISDPASADAVVVLSEAGEGATVSVAELMRRARRPRASANTRLLYECDEASNVLRSTGSDSGAAWDLTVRANSVYRSRPLASAIGPGFGVEYAATPTGAAGAAGMIPTGVTDTLTMWAVVCPIGSVVSGQSPVPIFTRDHNSTWSGPQTTSVGLYWGNALEARASIGSGAQIAYSFGRSLDGMRVVGLTYDGAALRLWYDGEAIATTAVSGNVAWGTDGEWQIGHNAQTLEWTGTILRCGLESVAWTADQWTAFVQTCRGDLG